MNRVVTDETSQPRGGLGEVHPRLKTTKGTLVVTCRLLGENPEATTATASPAATNFRPGSPGLLTGRRGPAWVRLPSQRTGRPGGKPGWSGPGLAQLDSRPGLPRSPPFSSRGQPQSKGLISRLSETDCNYFLSRRRSLAHCSPETEVFV